MLSESEIEDYKEWHSDLLGVSLSGDNEAHEMCELLEKIITGDANALEVATVDAYIHRMLKNGTAVHDGETVGIA